MGEAQGAMRVAMLVPLKAPGIFNSASTRHVLKIVQPGQTD